MKFLAAAVAFASGLFAVSAMPSDLNATMTNCGGNCPGTWAL